MPLFLATVVASLFFWRSMGLSVTSTGQTHTKLYISTSPNVKPLIESILNREGFIENRILDFSVTWVGKLHS